MEKAARQLREVLEAEVLERVRQAAPDFLEKVVIDLLITMGYGGGDATMGRVTGCSGDGGIDGTIKEDALGLDEVYALVRRGHHPRFPHSSAIKGSRHGRLQELRVPGRPPTRVFYAFDPSARRSF